MAKKGKKELNKAITALVKPFGVDKACLAEEWQYDFVKEKISFPLTSDDWTDDLYNKFVTKEFGLKDFDTFVISILHEVGHHMTNDDIDEMTAFACECKKIEIVTKLEQVTTLKQAEKIEMKYFKLPDEYAATKWAVDYYNTHRKKCENMARKASKAISTFKKANK